MLGVLAKEAHILLLVSQGSVQAPDHGAKIPQNQP